MNTFNFRVGLALTALIVLGIPSTSLAQAQPDAPPPAGSWLYTITIPVD
jgi:hypothetical protein